MLVKERTLRKILKELAISGEISNLESKPTDQSVSTNLPITAFSQASTQISADRPPIEDPNYYPSNTKELGRALQALSQDVPSNHVKKFYQASMELLRRIVEKSPIEDEDKGI